MSLERTASRPTIRVILVGDSSIVSRLRRSPEIELIRAPSPIDAVGELADPIDDESPRRSAILLGTFNDAFDAGEFLDAVRLVDPSAKAFLTHDANIEDSRAGPIARLDPEDDAGSIGERLRMAEPDGHTLIETRTSAAIDLEGLIDSVASLGDTVGDAALVHAVLMGSRVTPTAIALIRQRLSCPDVRFVPAPDSTEGVPVVLDGKVIGRLAGRVDSEQLASHAAWLAAWLELSERIATLQGEAIHDPLTGAYNRRFFDRFLEHAIAEARANRRPLTLLVFDIDDFKQFNDAHGHAVGDGILREATRLLRSVLRPTDKVCRIGGDEFAVIFYDPAGPRRTGSQPPSTVHEIARRFQEQICESRFPSLGLDAPGLLTISGGLAVYPHDGRTPAELLAHADRLALESKRLGKNAIRIGR